MIRYALKSAVLALVLAVAPALVCQAAAQQIIDSKTLSAPSGAIAIGDAYRIGPQDKISVHVFGQKDLSFDRLQVDASGRIVLPLIGVVEVEGKTAQELSTEIATKLGDKYLNSPSVSVSVDESVSQQVTVAGAVMEAGVFPLKGQTTLLQAVSMAKGPDNKIANLKEVAIFRTIDGKRARAVFNLDAIRRGAAVDPLVYGGDTVVVSDSKGLRAWREVVGALPALGVFAYF